MWGETQLVRVGHLSNLINHVTDRIDHQLRLLGLHIVGGVRVGDEHGAEAVGELALGGYIQTDIIIG